MASSYPGSLDSFTNPSSTDAMDASAALYHDVQHANINDAVEAVQAELGTDPAGVYPTVKSRLTQLSTAESVFGSWRAALSGPDWQTMDPVLATSAITTTSQKVWWIRWTSPATFSATKLWWVQTGAAATVTSATIGIYSDAGASAALLQSADIASAVTSTGLKSATITSQSIVADTSYYFAWLVNASTAGSIAGTGGTANMIAAMETTNGYGLGYTQTGQTSLPDPTDLTSKFDTANMLWFGISAA